MTMDTSNDSGNSTDRRNQFIFTPPSSGLARFCGGSGNGWGSSGARDSSQQQTFQDYCNFLNFSNRDPPRPTPAPSSDNKQFPDLVDAEKHLAEAMTDLTVQDREKALEDLHGIIRNESEKAKEMDYITSQSTMSTVSATSTSERDTLLLEQLDQEVKELLQKETKEHAYQIAERRCPQYIHNRNFRLAFLDATDVQFDPKLAASRMLQFLQFKLQHFGEDMLDKVITQNDLSPSVQAILKRGFYQYMGLDSAGRNVVGAFPSLLKYESGEDLLQMCFYWWTSLLANTSHHPFNRNMIMIQYSTGMNDPPPKFDLMMQSKRELEAMPMKICAYHVLVDYEKASTFSFQCIKITSKALSARTMFHFGHHVEVQYDLRRFGIDTSAFPVSLNGQVDMRHHHAYLERKRKEEMSTNDNPSSSTSRTTSPAILSLPLQPAPNDVLFGRGFNAQYHPGNKAFRKILEQNYHNYFAGDDTHKLVLVDYLADSMKTSLNSRFLKSSKSSDGVTEWEEVKDKRLIQGKFSQAFRNLKASLKRKQQQQQMQMQY